MSLSSVVFGFVLGVYIPSGDAPRELEEFSRQTDISVLYDFSIVRFYLTRSVVGQLKPLDALKVMLQGSNLTFEVVNDHTVAITEVVRICRPYSHLPLSQLPLPPCVQGPAAGEKSLTDL